MKQYESEIIKGSTNAIDSLERGGELPLDGLKYLRELLYEYAILVADNKPPQPTANNLQSEHRVRLIGTDQKATVIMVFSESLVVHFDGQPEHLMTAISKDLFEKIG